MNSGEGAFYWRCYDAGQGNLIMSDADDIVADASLDAGTTAAGDCEPPPPPLEIVRTSTDGAIPIFSAIDVKLISKSATNFDGIPPALDRLWFGPTTFSIGGEAWTLDSFLNFGAEGQTYVAIQKSTGKKFAAKFCRLRDSLEIKLCQKLPNALVTHPNFVTYEFLCMDINEYFSPAQHIIMMELVPNGELFDLLASPEPSVASKPVSEGTSRRFLHDVINGMAECYRFGITHRDLKPENLLINQDGRIVIIDMGHAKRSPPIPAVTRSASNDGPPPMPPLSRTTTTNAYGTEAFNAPEVRAGASYDCEASDVWSVGVIAFYMHGKLPAFKGSGGAGGVGHWDDIVGPDNEEFWTSINGCGYYPAYPDELRALINALWRIEPTDRPSFGDLERAITGDSEVLEKYPGLKWLNKPHSNEEEFHDELRRACPRKHFGAQGASRASPQRW